ncbi:hypothetical protein FRB95_011459 [Tulasnella sp. JGI-2019a]|nr:hypothetical protein FRB95_011459 [Tulasnella sp. JGI-2019a]
MTNRVPLLFGPGLFGQSGAPGVRTTDPAEAQHILDVFFAHGHNELDTARGYGGGTSEPFLAALTLKDGTIVDTKVAPSTPGDHKPHRLRQIFQESLNIFNPRGIKIRILYLHAPDRMVPFEETVAELNAMHKDGLYEQFGLSNFAAWEVAEIYTTCKERGYVLPTVYQGSYNLLARSIEPELVPCLRKFRIRLIVWNPLAGGFLTGKFLSLQDAVSAEKGGRFDKDTAYGRHFSKMYMNDENIRALRMVHEAVAKEHLTMAEVALRWLQHHSVLTPEDGIILGASNASQLESNLADSEKDPLPDTILPVIQRAWRIVAPVAASYWYPFPRTKSTLLKSLL